MASDAVIRNNNINNNNTNSLVHPQLYYPSAASAHRMRSSSCAASLIREFCDKPGSSSSTTPWTPSSFQPTLASQAYDSHPPSLHSPSQSSELSTDPPATFSEQEDETLRELVKRHGTKKWHIISAKMQQKTPRQCRKRWRTYLHMCMNKSSWSAEEDRLLLQGHNAYGNRWTEIAKMVPGRTDNAVKNRYNALCTKRSHRSAIRPCHTSAKRHMASWTNGQCKQGLKSSERHVQVEGQQQQRQQQQQRVANMAFLKSNTFETSCSRLALSIDIPEDLGLDRIGTGMKHTADNYAPDQNTSSENYLMVEDAMSPKDGQVDMEEVMSWLLTQTPTPTFDCGGNSNSTVTSCTESPSPSAIVSGEHESFEEQNFASSATPQEPKSNYFKQFLEG